MQVAASPLIATAIHNGTLVADEVAATLALADDDRRREEDPHTAVLAAAVPHHVVVHRSRFEFDLNRRRERAVYRTPHDAWGLELWHEPPTEAVIDRRLEMYDAFYAELAHRLQAIVARHGRFVLYDVHSYNHRRSGPDAAPDPPEENPVVNLGTRTLPDRWQGVADAFVDSMASGHATGQRIDVRCNVRFRGGYLSQWVHENFGDHGCALAIEFKKVFMDEWSGALDAERLVELRVALAGTTEAVAAAVMTAP